MNRTRFPRIKRRSLLVTVPVALLVALAGGLLASGQPASSAETNPTAAHHHDGASVPRTPAQVAFHDQMRRLWEDHITWTRLAIVTFADGSNGFSATADWLLRNQDDIGNTIEPFYGQAAAARLTALLRDHITIAVEVLQAVKAGDDAAFAEATARWYANANDIADFLVAANPRFWPQPVMRDAMKMHLDQTLTEAADELSGNYTASVAAYEIVHTHILAMADLLRSGIIGQFPARFH